MKIDNAIVVLEWLAHTESKWPGTEDTLAALDLAITALRGPTREMVERAWFREPYTRMETWDREDGATVYSARNTCMACGQETPIGNFCHNCGAALTDEAVEMVMERWKEAEKDAKK